MFWTPFGHSRDTLDTLEPGARRAPETPHGTLPRTHPFSGTLSETLLQQAGGFATPVCQERGQNKQGDKKRENPRWQNETDDEGAGGCVCGRGGAKCLFRGPKFPPRTDVHDGYRRARVDGEGCEVPALRVRVYHRQFRTSPTSPTAKIYQIWPSGQFPQEKVEKRPKNLEN